MKIRADVLLVERGLAENRTRARTAIMAGLVFSGVMLVPIWAPKSCDGGPPTYGNSNVLGGLAAHACRHFVHPFLCPQHENIMNFPVLVVHQHGFWGPK